MAKQDISSRDEPSYFSTFWRTIIGKEAGKTSFIARIVLIILLTIIVALLVHYHLLHPSKLDNF